MFLCCISWQECSQIYTKEIIYMSMLKVLFVSKYFTEVTGVDSLKFLLLFGCKHLFTDITRL